MREKVILICSKCLSRNYTTTRRKGDASTRLQLMKFCPKCNAQTLHKESK
ncbi:MAG: 50S ribosomal protein L33 [Coprobacillus sp.]|nr:50S ribosomal protein L33 [Coprobacillus sp.]